jgi:hypothetical protein
MPPRRVVSAITDTGTPVRRTVAARQAIAARRGRAARRELLRRIHPD